MWKCCLCKIYVLNSIYHIYVLIYNFNNSTACRKITACGETTSTQYDMRENVVEATTNSWFAHCLHTNSWFAHCLHTNSWFAHCLHTNSWFAHCLQTNSWFAHCLHTVCTLFAHCLHTNSWFAHCLHTVCKLIHALHTVYTLLIFSGFCAVQRSSPAICYPLPDSKKTRNFGPRPICS
jgi:hypothetical protein